MSNIDFNKTQFDTTTIHAGQHRDSDFGALAAPIYQTSTFTFLNAEHAMGVFSGEIPGYDYTRAGNPTVRVFEEKIAILEGGEDAAAASSGMGAISSTILGLFKSGDHIICSNTLYGCTDVIMRENLPSLGIETTFVDTGNPAEVEAAVRENTAAIYFEAAANPTMRVTDIAAMKAIAKKHGGIRVIVDNTFTPPPMLKPISLGADVVVHSVTKYLNGHGDVIAGVVVGSKQDIADIRSKAIGKMCGTPLSPIAAYLIIRGMKTLGLRVRKHCENAMALAEFLEAHPYVEKVYYPGLPSMGQDHEIAKKQMKEGLYSAMISFVLKEGIHGRTAFESGKKLMDNLVIPAIAVSLGDSESLIQHPASMTHVRVPKEVREQTGITDGMLRFSPGLEDAEDLISDFKQALDAI